MTKEAALHNFLSNAVSDLDMSVYAATNVPDDPSFPYLTYTYQDGEWEDTVSLTMNAWFKTTSEAVANSGARVIDAAIPRGGVKVFCDGGMLWLKRDKPWRLNQNDPSDDTVKRRYFNLGIEFLTIE